MKTTRYTVVTDSSNLGRWLRSKAEAMRIAAMWRSNGLVTARVIDEHGAEVPAV